LNFNVALAKAKMRLSGTEITDAHGPHYGFN
jgi:hypothetical protein